MAMHAIFTNGTTVDGHPRGVTRRSLAPTSLMRSHGISILRISSRLLSVPTLMVFAGTAAGI